MGLSLETTDLSRGKGEVGNSTHYRKKEVKRRELCTGKVDSVILHGHWRVGVILGKL